MDWSNVKSRHGYLSVLPSRGEEQLEKKEENKLDEEAMQLNIFSGLSTVSLHYEISSLSCTLLILLPKTV